MSIATPRSVGLSIHKGLHDCIHPVFKAVPRSIITSANNPSTPATIVVGDKHAEGAFFDIDIVGTLDSLQQQQSQMQKQITTLEAQAKKQEANMNQEEANMKQEEANMKQEEAKRKIDTLEEVAKHHQIQITALQKEADQLLCSICEDNPKNTRNFCKHVFCEDCLHDIINHPENTNGQLLCPICRAKVGPKFSNPSTGSPYKLFIL
jgi:rubrerythrin